MNYNRYLDIHLCTNTSLAGLEAKQRKKTTYSRGQFFGGENPYFYEFNKSLMQQMRYREAKNEGFTFNEQNNGNCRIVSDKELTHAGGINWLRLFNGRITQEMRQLRYIGCLVAIENLKTDRVYPQLEALMHWVSDPTTVNKVRINCHGSGDRQSGMSMGAVELSPDELIEALTRHGLTRPSSHAGAVMGLAVGARWKLDSESKVCEQCRKEFKEGMFTSGKHHCRRCGGLFCDKCSSKKADLAVALTGEKVGGAVKQHATAKNIKKARVCDTCFKAAQAVAPLSQALAEDKVLREVFGDSLASSPVVDTGLTNYGLKTICLACCMGAKADDDFSAERNQDLVGPQLASTTFVQDSLAARLLIALRARNLTGIKLTASNQVLADHGQKGIAAQCGITVPSEKGSGASLRDRDDYHPFVGGGNQSLSFPAYIWGRRQSLKAKYDQLARLNDAANPLGFAGFGISDSFGGDIKVEGRRLLFGEAEFGELRTLYSEFLSIWKFTSWTMSQAALVAQPGGNPRGFTWALTPPPRVTQVSLIPGTVAASGGNSIAVSVRSDGLESFKHYKSYEVS